MRTARVLGLLLVAAAGCSLCGCIVVDDLGGYWEKGVLDPQLQGYWKWRGTSSFAEFGDTYVCFEPEGDHYLRRTRHTSDLANAPSTASEVKTLTLGKHRFLMSGPVRTQPELLVLTVPHPWGLQRYSINGNVLTLYYLDESVLHDAIAQGRVAGRWPAPDVSIESMGIMDPQQLADTVPAISKLDDQSIAFIESVADQPGCWHRVERFQRIADITKEMKAAHKYPATRKTPANTLVTINLPDLKYFAESETDVLLRQLEASPEWMVTKDGLDVVAYQRGFEGGRWLGDPYSGFQVQRQNGMLTRSMFRFADSGGGQFADVFSRPFLTMVEPSAGKVHLKLTASGRRGIQSYLAVGHRGLWFEYCEETAQENRVRTREALKWVAGFLRKVRQREGEIRRDGFAPLLMPPNSYRQGEPSLEVSGSQPAGAYDVVAWANPGKDGYVWLRAFDAGTGAELSSPGTFIGPSEFIGWSDGPKMLFRYDSMVGLPGEGEGRHFEARIELWFHPSDGTPEVKLVETTCPVDAPPRSKPAVAR
jgi:hypothetical protein